MKKIICTLMAMIMIVMCFAACSSGKGNTSYDDLAIAYELTSEEYGIGFRKGSDLVKEVDTIINDLIEDGTLAALAEKYELTLAEEPKANDDYSSTIADLDYVKGNGTLIIGITDYAPMNYKDEEGEWTGFDTEFANAVCEKLGVEAQFVEIDWDNKFLALEAKTIDCIWNGMTISEEVLNNTSCSQPYVKNAQVVVISKDKLDQYASIDDMKDLTFAVETGSAGAQAAEDNGLNKIEVGTQTDALLEVTSGSSDACIIDITMANAMIGK